jgi:hypothetical protein
MSLEENIRQIVAVSLDYKDLSFTFLLLKDSYYEFCYSFNRFTPTFQLIEHMQDTPFESVLRAFARWLTHDLTPYMNEETAQDPWQTLKEETNFISNLNSNENFTPSEIKHGESVLNHLAERIEAVEAKPEIQRQLKQFAEDIREIKEDLKKLKKKKWSWQAVGIIFQIINFAKGLEQESFIKIKEAISDFFGQFTRDLIA